MGGLAKTLAAATLIVATLASAQELVPASREQKTELIAEPEKIPGTRVSAILPEGFSVAESYAGLEHELVGTSVVFTELARPLEDIQLWMDYDALEARGMRRVHVEDLVIPAAEAELYHVEEDTELVELYHWMLLVDGGDRTLFVVVTTHAVNESRLRPDVLQLFEALRWNPDERIDPLAELPFRVDAVPPLVFSPRISERVVLVRGDQIGPLGGGDPRAFVSQHNVATEIEDLERHAHEHLQLSDQTSTLEIVSGRPSKLGGLPAYEIVAHGKDFERMTPLVIYQVLAMDGQDYYVVQGFASRSETDTYLPEFRKLAQSFRRAR